MRLNIQLFGGRGASLGTTKGGELQGYTGKDNSTQLDVSSLSGFPVKLQNEFEDFMRMKSQRIENAYLIDKNGKVVAGATGDRHSVGVAYDGDQKGMTLTHNHPSSYGGTFSGADIYHLTKAELKSIRAVAKEGTYTMTAKRNANYMGLNRALAKDLPRIKSQASKRATIKANSGASRKVVRKAYVDTLHSWYKRNASKYGFDYSFKSNKDYKLK